MITSKPLGIWFQSSGASMEEGSPLDRNFLIVLLLLSLIILGKRKFNWSNALEENIWVMLLVAYMLFSILWSDAPFLTFKRWSRQIIAVVMAFIVATEPYPRKSLESLFRRIIYILIPFSYILINYFAEYGRLYVHHAGVLMWVGATVHKNCLARLCLFAVFFVIWSFIKRWRGKDIDAVWYLIYLDVFIIILAFWLMGGPQHSFTYSATSTAALAVGFSALAGLYWEKKTKRRPMLVPKALIILIFFTIIYGTVTPFSGRLTGIDVSKALGRDSTLTGRTRVWKQLIPVAMKKPILGYGFDSFWTTTTRDEFDISGAHNGYLDMILGLGFFGLLLYMIFLLFSSLKAKTMISQDFDWGVLWLCYLLMAVVHNIAETSVMGFTNDMSAIILFLSVSYMQVTSNITNGELNNREKYVQES